MGSLRGIVANVFDCSIIVSKFELQWHKYIRFRTHTLRKSINRFISTTYLLNNPFIIYLQRWLWY